MNCPKCSVLLQMSERQGIEIDYCPQCRGVWLDRGELDKIIERSATEIPQRAHQERYDHHDNRHADKHHENEHDTYHHKRKKSFLLDLFD